MNTRAHWRLILGIVAVVLTLGVAVTLVFGSSEAGRSGSIPSSVTMPVQPVTVVVAAKFGGFVAEVHGKPGARLNKGGLLLRLETASLARQRRDLVSAIRVTRAALSSSRELSVLPGALRSAVVEVHPDVTAAEDRYIRSVADLDRVRSFAADLPAAQSAWRQASAARTSVRERIGRSFASASAAADLESMIPLLEGRIRDLDRSLTEAEVRAPADSVIDILDLRPGDRLLPGNPVAVLLLPGEYFCDFPVPSTVSAALSIGMTGRGFLGTRGEAISWRIESLRLRTIPVGLRENRQVAQETEVRARFSAGDVSPGSLAILELPRLRTAR